MLVFTKLELAKLVLINSLLWCAYGYCFGRWPKTIRSIDECKREREQREC